MINIGRNNINTNQQSDIDIKSTPYIDRLYSCRDLEISNLWQRSIFLAVFLLLIFTGYGTLLTKALEEFKYLGSYNIYSFGLYNAIFLIIAVIGCIFSLLWIFMAKGSKAWYEIYGEAIADYERCYPTNESEEAEVFGMGKNYHPSYKSNNCIFSTKGGAYSVSKVNILIGQISLMLWCALGVIHLLLLICIIFWTDTLYFKPDSIVPTILLMVLLVLIIALGARATQYIFKNSRSSSLYFNEYKPFFDPEKNKYSEDEIKDNCQSLARILHKIENNDNLTIQEQELIDEIKENFKKLNPVEQKRYQYAKDKISVN